MSSIEKILIVGDSLTAGHPGASFVDTFVRMVSHQRVIAEGRGGDTLFGISQRLPNLLERHRPDILVIEAGTNDLLLPWFRIRGGAWKKLSVRLIASGSVPTTEVSSFHSLYAGTLATAKRYTARIAVTTISCLGKT